jgi:hypothetical protein
MPGKHEIKELQKTAILATARILRKAEGKDKAIPVQALTVPRG